MKTDIIKFQPIGERELSLADFWYHKGKAESELETVTSVKNAMTKVIQILNIEYIKLNKRKPS